MARRLSLTIRFSVVTGPHQAVSQVAETGYVAKARADTERGKLGENWVIKPCIPPPSLSFSYKFAHVMFVSQGQLREMEDSVVTHLGIGWLLLG